MDKIKQHKYDRMYMKLAIETATMSHAIRRKVGAILVLPNGLLSQGWNGMPSGMDNCCETILPDGDLHTREEVIHAEDNVLNKITKSTLSSEGSTLYLTDSPCWRCAGRIHGSGIKRVVYLVEYRIAGGLQFLKDRGLEVVHLTDPDLYKLYAGIQVAQDRESYGL